MYSSCQGVNSGPGIWEGSWHGTEINHSKEPFGNFNWGARLDCLLKLMHWLRREIWPLFWAPVWANF